MSTSNADGDAYDADAVQSGLEWVDEQHRVKLDKAYRQALADDAEKAVKVIQAKHDGIKDSLAAAKADAKRLRSEAEGA